MTFLAGMKFFQIGCGGDSECRIKEKIFSDHNVNQRRRGLLALSARGPVCGRTEYVFKNITKIGIRRQTAEP